MKKFDINNKNFDMIIEKEPTDQYKPAYIIDEEKVKKIIELHGGTIECDSIISKGTKFTIILPIESNI